MRKLLFLLSLTLTTLEAKEIAHIFIHGTTIPWFCVDATRHIIDEHELKDDNFYPLDMLITPVARFLHTYSHVPHQPIQQDGLKEIPETDITEGDPVYASKLIADSFICLYKNALPQNNNTHYFYTFGWNGWLSESEREKATMRLYHALQTLAHINPEYEIYLYGHSHGGTIASNLARIEQKEHYNIRVAKLVLIGCPIFKLTYKLLNSPVWNRVYHIYSKKDYMQVADAWSSNEGLPARKLDPDTLAPHVTQIELSVEGYNPSHYELSMWALVTGKYFIHKQMPFLYRKRFPLYPFPVLAFIPLITQWSDQNKETSQRIIIKDSLMEQFGELRQYALNALHHAQK